MYACVVCMYCVTCLCVVAGGWQAQAACGRSQRGRHRTWSLSSFMAVEILLSFVCLCCLLKFDAVYHVHACTHTHGIVHTHLHTHTRTHTHTHTPRTHAPTRTYTPTHTYTHPRTRAGGGYESLRQLCVFWIRKRRIAQVQHPVRNPPRLFRQPG